jgi:hypothetical protein
LETIEIKIIEIKKELEKLGLTKKQAPVWVYDYNQLCNANEEDFIGWLQFAYLPNYKQANKISDMQKLVVPQAIQFFKEDAKKEGLLQLLIELDSL